jgi:signal transduction histidine kinase/CheY-like chemotaxis protein
MRQVDSEGALSHGFLSTEIASRQEKKLALIVVLVSLAGFAAGIPLVRTQLPDIPAFIPAYEAALWVTDTITAVLLFSQFARLRSRALLMVASGYLFDGLMVIPHALSFPGVFAETGLLSGGPQTTAWLYMFWHFGFPLFVLAYALMARRNTDEIAGGPTRAIAGACAGVAVLVAGLTLMTTAGHDLLPVIMQGSDYSLNITKGFSPALWAVTAATLLALWLRSIPTVLETWLMVVLVAWLLDIAASAVLGSHRYDFGWYAGRLYGLLAASFVLIALLVETNRLYGNLIKALGLAERRNADLIRSREEFAQVQRFEAVGQLVAGIAHDFNNILTVITGGLDLILRDPAVAGRKNQRLLEASLKAALRGERMTQQLLTFARRQVLRPEIVNPNEVIANLESFIARAAGENVHVITKLSPVLWPARIDRTQFETALVNLVVNARDAMNGGGEVVIETRNIVLDAEAFPDMPAGDYLLVTVTDTGRGMTPEVAARAFDPFFTTKEAGRGSGLGLSQVYGFARSASGCVRIGSKPGTETTIEIYLPKSSMRPAQPEEPFALAPIRRSAGGEMVLVVEDDPDVLEIAVSGLADLGYQVKTATDAQEALRILRADPTIEVLFSDVVMPGGMNGAQLAVEAQRIQPNLKVLLTSGYAASALAVEHGLPETLEFLRKPFRRDELASKLRLVIGR